MNTFENGMRKLLIGHLSELYFCESRLLKALENMANAAMNDRLKRLFMSHRTETMGHVARLEACFSVLHETPQAYPCRSIDGLLEDGKWIIHTLKDDPSLDLALVAAAQKVETFEASSYRSAIHLAKQLGLEKVVELLKSTLQEEEEADAKLSKVLQQDGVDAR